MVGLWFEDESYVGDGDGDGDEEIATSQTEYFSKPWQNPVFTHLENTENQFKEGSSRGA